jgi:hypothetical protein
VSHYTTRSNRYKKYSVTGKCSVFGVGGNKNSSLNSSDGINDFEDFLNSKIGGFDDN